MSILAYPRIHFKGKCSVNPPTGNNDDVVVNIDSVNVRLGDFLQSLSDDEARAWMMEGFQAVHPQNGQLHWYLKSGWNYFGDGSLRFVDVAVTTVTGPDGTTGSLDKIVGQSVEVLGSPGQPNSFAAPLPAASDRNASDSSDLPPAMICDLDPLGTALTQLFIGRFVLGDTTFGLEATYDTLAFGRWVMWRNATVYQGEQNYPACSATWQFAIPKKELMFHGAETSPAIASMKEAALKAEGIVVQFCLYLPEPGITDEDLIAKFRRREFEGNPVTSLLVGTIGVWEKGELMTAPAGRLLLPAIATVLGPATARVQRDRDVVSLNLLTTFPEADFIRPPAKSDFGHVRLGFIAASGGKPVLISGPIAYDYSTYESTGGVLDVAYDTSLASRDQLEKGTLLLFCESDGTTPPFILLKENEPAIVIETDDRGVYLDVGKTGTISILVQERGGPPSKDVTVYLWEYQYVISPDLNQQRAGADLTLVEPGSGLDPRVLCPKSVVYRKNQSALLPIDVTAQRPGGVALAFTVDGNPLLEGNPWDTASYAGIRVMPQDDFSSVKESVRVTWDFVYEKVWKFYFVVYPAMSKVIKLNEETTMEKVAQELVAITNPALRRSTRYMPPTRDLSTGKRALLIEWANEVAPKSSRRSKKKP
jgi:hypothetical protein